MDYVVFFDEGRGDQKDLLGGKGANLCEMTRLGLPVPPGFTITTDACRYYSAHGQVPEGMWDQVKAKVEKLQNATGKAFGSSEKPLLVSVRSGAKFSMPGMMDTILNLGMNDVVVETWAKATGNDRAAWDSYRRFIQMFGDVVMDVPKHEFEEALEHAKAAKGVKLDTELDAGDLRELVGIYKRILREGAGVDFPQDPWEQLQGAVQAVFRSWGNKRAVTYRQLHGIPDSLGTACNVQAMVFGNLGDNSGTGVGFTRNPATGELEPFGEFLINAQGEDVVAGVRTPEPLSRLQNILPEVYAQLLELTRGLEKTMRDMQDFEFTVEDGKLYMLQTRNGKRTAKAAVKIATDLAREGLITQDEALSRVDPASLDQLLHPTVRTDHGIVAMAKG
ncbi:MAG TPA: PEP/pyruvate-binding domain-containing protein, partial [Deinococcales bacterium]|nr:PEP/pyruvate-binding domain-containing protein [Deinococcales bacterium]